MTERRGRRHDQRGVALVIAMAVTMVVILLSLAAVRQSVEGVNQSGIASKQVSSIDASEAGIQAELNAMVAAVAGNTTFTCAGSTAIGPSTPYQASYHLTIAVGTAAGTTPPAASSTPCTGAAMTPKAGYTYLVQSTGTTTSSAFGARTTQASIYVPVGGVVLDQTIFGDTSLDENPMSVIGTAAGGIYTNGNWECFQAAINSNVIVYGTGATTLQNSCIITGNLFVDGTVEFYTGSSVSVNTETPSSFLGDQNPNGAVSGHLYSNSTAPTGTTCGSGLNFSACYLYPNGPPAMPNWPGTSAQVPPKESLPVVPFTCATPTSATCGSSPWPGWTVDNEGVAQNGQAVCSFTNAKADANNGRAAGTILYWPASCSTSTSNFTPPTGTPMPVGNNFAIVAPGGVDFDNEATPLTYSTTTGTGLGTHTVFVVVPTTVTAGTTTTTTCGSAPTGAGDVDVNDVASFPSTLNISWFTPCTMTFGAISNGSGKTTSALSGQLYAGVMNTGTSCYVTGVEMALSGATGGGAGAGSASGTPVLGTEVASPNPSGYN